MEELSKILYIAERDIDLLLLEELNVNTEFASWLFQQTNFESRKTTKCIGAWHSVNHPQLGESDLVVMFEHNVAILVENKVDAPAQPDQAVRYKKRGEKGIKEKLWSSFVTCIIAPRRYLKSDSEVLGYDIRLSYEKIRDWFEKEKSQRAIYRAHILNEAIEQNRRGYSPVADDDVTKFWSSYWNLAREQFPKLEMLQPGIKPANSDWPYFRPDALGKDLKIVHKMAQGNVDLQVRGAAERLDQIRSYLDDPALKLVTAGKSGAVRIVVDSIDRFGSFDAQKGKVICALEAAEKLLQIGREMRYGI